MSKKPNLKIIILCGGKGERLHPLTNDIPKPLLQIKGKPILSYIIEHLSYYNLYELIITIGYKSKKISDFIASEYPTSCFRLIDSGEVDIIRRIQDSLDYIDEDFMVLYGDTLSDVPILELIKHHKLNERPATMTVWPLRSQFGIVELDKADNVLGFKEKPKLDKWINIGYFYFNQEMKELIQKYDSFAEFLRILAEKGLLNAYKHNGIHITVNTIKELADAEKNIERI